MATDAQNLARRAPYSAHARQQHEALIRLLNTRHVRGFEKQEVQELYAANLDYATAILAAVREEIEARAALAPPGLHDWGRRQRFSRAYARTTPDLSEPSYFNTRSDYTMR